MQYRLPTFIQIRVAQAEIDRASCEATSKALYEVHHSKGGVLEYAHLVDEMQHRPGENPAHPNTRELDYAAAKGFEKIQRTKDKQYREGFEPEEDGGAFLGHQDHRRGFNEAVNSRKYHKPIARDYGELLDEVEAKLIADEEVSPELRKKVRVLGAINLIKSGRGADQLRGQMMLEEMWGGRPAGDEAEKEKNLGALGLPASNGSASSP